MKYLFVYFVTVARKLDDDFKAALMGKVIDLQLHKVPFLGFYDNSTESGRQSADLIIKSIGFVAARSQSDQKIGDLGSCREDLPKITKLIMENPNVTGGELLARFGSLNELRRDLRGFIKAKAKALTEQDLVQYNICVVGDPAVMAIAMPHPATTTIPGAPEVWQWMVGVKGDDVKIFNVVKRG